MAEDIFITGTSGTAPSKGRSGPKEVDRGRFLNVKSREFRRGSSRLFSNRLCATKETVQRLSLYGTLDAHKGCVNTVQFNAAGDVIFSGSDDQRIILWDWARKKKKLVYDSGHNGNVFQAKPMPFTNDSHIVSCAADGEVRVGYIAEGSENVLTRCLADHRGRAHKLSIEPGSPNVFFSCGEDGIVRQFDLRDQSTSKVLFHCREKSTRKRPIPLNAIMVDPIQSDYLTVGASDEYVRVYDRRHMNTSTTTKVDHDPVLHYYAPVHLRGKNSGRAHITCVAYSYNGEEILATYNDELIYLFNVNRDPISESEDYVLLRKSEEEEDEEKEDDEDEEEDDMDDDIDGEESEDDTHEEGNNDIEEIKQQKMEEENEVDVNNVKRKSYRQKYEGHRNADTVKGVNFFGPRSEFVVSGSDCGHVFIWDKKTAKLLNLMKGDKRVVNCLESHPSMPILATSGIDKNVKIWTPTAESRASLKEAQKVMASNQRARSNGTHRFNLTVPLIMRFLRLQQAQMARQQQQQRASESVAVERELGEEEDEEDAEDAVECTTS